ncbi:6-phosphofructokinase [Natronospora cellulosivora (SeqCode)]
MSKEIKKIGILTGGGDCPGLNAVIRAITKTAILKYGIEVEGFVNGYKGLFNGETRKLDLNSVEDILSIGGTIIHTSNKTNLFKMPFKEDGELIYKDLSDVGVENIKKAGMDVLVIVGGDGTLTSARDFHRKGVNIIAVPKTIDNDLACTDITFGYDTAVAVATEALDRLHTTAFSHHRIMCLEVMGRYAGWIGLEAGLAGGADAILIPEIPYDINKVAEKIKENQEKGKNYSIVVVAEGAKSVTGEMVVKNVVEDSPDPIRLGGIADQVSNELEKLVGLESRATVLGHIQRGGSPTAFDRNISTRYGNAAVELAMKGKFGEMVTLNGNQIGSAALEDVIGQLKNVDPEGELVQTAKAIGITFGD